MHTNQNGISGLVLLAGVVFSVVLLIFINQFIFPLRYFTYYISNPVVQNQIKEVNKKAQEQAKKEDEIYQTFKNSGVIAKPTYLPPNVGEPIEEERLGMIVQQNKVFGHSIKYTCDKTPASLIIKYFPLGSVEKKVTEEIDYYKIDLFIKSLIDRGDMTFREIKINDSRAYFNTYSRSWRPYDVILGWETDKVSIQIWKYPDCRLSKEELIKIAESMY